jgi:hypothetical protein
MRPPLLRSLADSVRQSCLDPVEFPTSATELTQGDEAAATFVIERCRRYWEITEPLAEAVMVAGAWAKPEHFPILARTMKVIANTDPIEG